jgi:hypothetical protein
MAYTFVDGRIGAQPIAENSTTQRHPLGTILRAVDTTYGEGEFIYLKGVASTAVGSTATYNTTSYTTALAPVGANKAQPIAWAMSACVASEYGWYQISGMPVAKKTCTVSLAANAAVGVLTVGLVAGTGSGKEIHGALVAAVASATAGRTTVTLVANRPHMQGRVT